MSDPDVLAEARRWLTYADQDVGVAEALMRQAEGQPRHICFYAQQGAEKSLKAALILEQIEFPYVHDLDTLRNLLPERWNVKITHPDLRALSEWAVEARYPGDWPDATRAEAEAAASQARSVFDSIRHDLLG